MILNATNWPAIKRDLEDYGLGMETDSGFHLIHEGSWSVDYKYQFREMVFMDLSNRKYYRYLESRSGSPFTDYYYEDVNFSDVHEVKQVERIIKVWEKI